MRFVRPENDKRPRREADLAPHGVRRKPGDVAPGIVRDGRFQGVRRGDLDDFLAFRDELHVGEPAVAFELGGRARMRLVRAGARDNYTVIVVTV